MISLRFNSKHTELEEGNIIHLKIGARKTIAPGKYEIWVDDITPLPGAEPTGYGCHSCGMIEEAKEDGSLPDGWMKKEFPNRSFFICADCQKEEMRGSPYCRVCGCSEFDPCFDENNDPCYWVEEDLCSACAKSEVKNEQT
ncbi:MAG: hypothetical protein PHU23_18330 [Dehalococcoidales bacterium]|nr:hypothetical protein [Dehalococcoidales bacterium]